MPSILAAGKDIEVDGGLKVHTVDEAAQASGFTVQILRIWTMANPETLK